MDEHWEPVPGYEEAYEVSNSGRVRRVAPASSTFVGRIRKPVKTSHGYHAVDLCVKGVRRQEPVHRLVASAFLGHPQPGQMVNHKSGNRTDNRVENLEWVTPLGNFLHARSRGTLFPPPSQAKLTTEQVGDIRALVAGSTERGRGKKPKGALTYAEIGRRYGVTEGAIRAIAKSRSWST